MELYIFLIKLFCCCIQLLSKIYNLAENLNDIDNDNKSLNESDDEAVTAKPQGTVGYRNQEAENEKDHDNESELSGAEEEMVEEEQHTEKKISAKDRLRQHARKVKKWVF